MRLKLFKKKKDKPILLKFFFSKTTDIRCFLVKKEKKAVKFGPEVDSPTYLLGGKHTSEP